MTAEEISNIIEQPFYKEADLRKLNASATGTLADKMITFLKIFSCASSITEPIEATKQMFKDYKTGEFFRKFIRYIYGLVNTTLKERHEFAEEIREKAKDMPGNVIFGIVDRMDNINKEEMLAKLTIARINNMISIEDFFRLSSMLERIPYIDLTQLPYYKDPYYDESGDTELLYATGALKIHTINANETNKYVLSTLGANLLHYGCGIAINVENKKGTHVGLEVDVIGETLKI